MKKALAMVLGAIVSVQIGAGLAKSAFPLTTPLGMAWLRFVCAGAILLLFVRPHLRGKNSCSWKAMGVYCLALVGMNISIYQAMAEIPLGMAVTIEFLGPLAVGTLTRRGVRDLIWVALAGVGVALLGWSPDSLTWAGVGYALLAALCWGTYIMVVPHVGKHWAGAEPVALANAVGALALTGPVLASTGTAFGQWKLWCVGLGVGLLSSIIPYVLELNALQRMERRVFSILMSLEPAVAALAGLFILNEHLGWTECLAMVCVMIASIGITWTSRRGRITAKEVLP